MSKKKKQNAIKWKNLEVKNKKRPKIVKMIQKLEK